MVTKSNGIPFRRVPHVTDVAIGAIPNLANRRLQSLFAPGTANDRELLSILRDVSVADSLKQRTGRASAQRDFCQRPSGHPVQGVMPSQGKSHSAIGGNSQNIRGRQSKASRFQSFEPRTEYLEGLIVPGCAVNHVLSVWSETSTFDIAAPKDELMEGRMRGSTCSHAAKKPQP